MFRRLFRLLSLSLFPLAFVGCGRSNAPIPAGGLVLLDGQPLAGASVVLEGGDGGGAAYAMTDAQGAFKLTTRAPNDGVPAGHYKVAVRWEAVRADTPVDEAGLEVSVKPPPVKRDRTGLPIKVDARPAGDKRRLPALVQKPGSSPLEATVARGKENHFTFALASGP